MSDRVDVYALGVMLYEMLAGTAPFEGDPVTVMRQHMFRELPPPPQGVPAAAADLLRDMLVKQPHGRPSMAQVVERLDQIGRMGPTAAPAAPASGAASDSQRASFAPTHGFEVAQLRATATRLLNEAKLRRTEVLVVLFLLGAVAWVISMARSSPESAAQQPAQQAPEEGAPQPRPRDEAQQEEGPAADAKGARSRSRTEGTKRSKQGSRRVIHTPFGPIYY
jgi:serine/threonine-protein kinase